MTQPTPIATLPPPPKKGFDWGHFLFTLAAIAPGLTVASLQIAHEAGHAPNTTTASDALHLATGVTQALASGNPLVSAAAATASALIDGVISAIVTHHTV